MNWKYKDGKFSINDESLLIPEFKDLYDMGEIGLQHLKFVYLTADVSEDNPLRNMSYTEKEEKAEQICYSKNPESINYVELAKEIETAITITNAYKRYLELNETSPMRLIISIDKKIDQIRKTVEELEPKVVENYNEKTGATTFASNMKIITDILSEMDNLMSTRESISKKLIKESIKVKAKGNKERSPLQEGMLKKIEV